MNSKERRWEADGRPALCVNRPHRVVMWPCVFGPQARLLVAGKGKQPELKKPIVLSPEGKKVEKEELCGSGCKLEM